MSAPTWEIIHGDCLEVMRGMADGSVDAIVTDPPYNVGFAYTGDVTGDRRADYMTWCAEWFAQTRRVSRGPVLISCGVANMAAWGAMARPDWVLCWWKPASMGRCPVGFNNWEPILVYGKTSGKAGADVVRAPIVVTDDTGGHPCPKPLEWARGQMERCIAPGSVILDPFCGSGTTGVAAIERGHPFIGIEREAAYVEIASRRVGDAAAQGSLFTGEAA